MSIIDFRDVWEIYRIKFIIDGKMQFENYWALKGITFSIDKGETLGIVGENGAGKSTVLRLIAGMIKPDRGTVDATGRVSGLLELGAGFQHELTGLENLRINAGLFGLSTAEVEEKRQDIEKFADIGRFIHAPVKYYSQGMFVRLAFAVAIHADPDILLIDDALAVGDEHFQKKCIKKIFELKELGKTILFVTHDKNMLNSLCRRALMLKDGRLIKDSSVDEIVSLYQTVDQASAIGSANAGKDSETRLTCGDVTLVFEKGRAKLLYKKKPITTDEHIVTFVCTDGKWNASYLADWRVMGEQAGKLVARGRWPGLPLEQVLEIELKGGCVISLRVSLEVDEPIRIEEQHVQFMLARGYGKWFSEYGYGDLPDTFFEVQTDIPQRCIAAGDVGLDSADKSLPDVTFKFSKELNNFAKIFNSSFYNKARIIRIDRVEPQENILLRPGRHECFSIEAEIGKEKNVFSHARKARLSEGALDFSFDFGSGRIYWGKEELTSRLGLYTSLRSGGRWYDSRSSARWRVEGNSPNFFKVIGKWSHLPLSQFWEARLKGNGLIEVLIDMEVEKEFEIDRLQTNLMVSENYDRWTTSNAEGHFPLFKGDIDDDWDRIGSGGQYIGVSWGGNKDKPRPSILFMPGPKNNGHALNLINSDIYHRSRVLQCADTSKTLLAPGRYPFFRGQIQVKS
jgi:ABC-type polysaccharide/polyol phosphate transport system ATPase subunit